MPGLDIEEFYETDSSDNDENHSRLLSSVSQLDSTQRVKPAQRKEIASEVSEYNLSRGISNRKSLINVKELAKVLGKKSEHVVISKKFRNVTGKAKTLPKPLEKPTEEKLKRSVGFENVKKQLRRWDAIVTRNALNDHISFPLNDNSMKMQKSNDFLSQFKSATPLEEEIAKVLKEENTKKDVEEEIQNAEFPLTLEEMIEKRKEMAQMRAKLSYKQSKAQRQSKIKSKKYHRLLKREKVKEQLKEFEMLQKTDPEAALKKLAELDKTRVQERASLRHRNTGQWARNLTVRAKYDVETRKVLAEQLKVSRELTQKISHRDSSDNEEEQEELLPETSPSIIPPATSSTDNPWTLDVSKEVQDFVIGYKKFWDEKNKEEAKKKSNEITVQVNGDDFGKIAAVENEKLSEDNKESQKALGDQKESQKAFEDNKVMKKASEDNKVCQKALEDKVSQKASEYNEVSQKALEDNKVSQKASKDKRVSQKSSKVKSSPKIKKAKVSPKKAKTCVSIQPASGVWIVEPVLEESKRENRSKRKFDDIDSLFEELNDKLMKKAVKKAKRIKRNLKKMDVKEKAKEKDSSDEEVDLTLKNTNAIQRPDMDVGLLEGDAEDIVNAVNESSVNVNINETVSTETLAIDPKNFIQIKPKRLKSYLPENVTGDEDALDDEKAQQKMMEEAFGDDDVMAEFNKMKREEEKTNEIIIQKSLPGWGKWGGTGIVERKSKRRKRLLVWKTPPRKDKKKKDTIINENENPNLKHHLVKEVPHPFKSVEAFEANIRAPIGRDWVPETAHQKLIQKPVVTKLGAIIEPMNEDEIIRLKKASKSPYQGKKKKESE